MLAGFGVLGAGAAVAALAAAAPAAAHAAERGLSSRLADLEAEHAARLGVFAYDTDTGRTVTYRADERFPMCSVFKGPVTAAVLRDLDRDGEYLARRIRYTEEYVTAAGYAPITGTDENIANG